MRKNIAPRLPVTSVVNVLHKRYGSPNLNNKVDPLDELVFIILSQMTTYQSYERVYNRLKARFATWDELAALPPARIRTLIRDAGLSEQKAPRIKAVLRAIQTEFGSATLEPLKSMDDAEVESYLLSLPGVGMKTAHCVMLFSLGRKVLPVDTHVARVARRLGWAPQRKSGVESSLETIVRPAHRYRFHTNAIMLGRDSCRALRPRCSECVVRAYCPSRGPGVK